MADLKIMWRIPANPTDESRRTLFIDQIAETLDFISGRLEGAFLDDHFFPWAAIDHPGGREFLSNEVDTLECWTAITYWAAAFPKLDFGALVLCQSYRHPAVVAKMGATLNLLTGGRFVMGLGAGWREDEYQAYGFDFPAAGVRLTQLAESIEIIKAMWAGGAASYSGKYYQIHNAYCEPTPNPMPPLLIGGGGEKVTLRIVAKHADWWNYCDTPEVFGQKLEILRQHCLEIGRPFDEIVKTWDGIQITVAESDAEAQRIFEASPYRRRGRVVGTPDRVAARLKQYIDLGVDIFFLRFDDFPEQRGIRLFTEEVLPQLQIAHANARQGAHV
jgi:alkanesulfonate monooxygenase SsuD/methylene tetrahydromethanopterin reductase-like flavin-dependent oxidoreductase (luciferase family)